MSDLLAARSQMAFTLAFHIVFAVAGIGLPVLMVLAEWRWLRTGEPVYLELAKRWSKGAAILFAVGAVSGTVLSFELGLLWPHFMAFAGPIIGMPFSLEGFAFFTEAIFLGVYLYGWDRIRPRAHLLAGAAVAVSGAISGVFIVMANAWMNAPAGFTMVDGRVTAVDPIAAMFNDAWPTQTLHMTLAAYAALGFAVAGIHAFRLSKDTSNAFHRAALRLALLLAIPAALLQPVSGDLSARFTARNQPAKLAAMEGQFATQRGAPLRLGGWPDVEAQVTRFAIEIPNGLSLLAFHDPDAEVKGLDAVPREDWPPVLVTHVAFQVMVASGGYLALVALWALVVLWRRRELADRKWLLRVLAVATPLGMIAVEAGWFVTEVGRQPWIIQGVARTADAVTPMPGLIVPFLGFTVLYLFLSVVVIAMFRAFVLASPRFPAPPPKEE
jgi:cytochrome d ubiquinol oxidase subunit I